MTTQFTSTKRRSLILCAMVAASLAFSSSGCGVIVNGGYQDLDVRVSDARAVVKIDGKEVRPGRVRVARDDKHLVQADEDGCKKATVYVDSEVTAWMSSLTSSSGSCLSCSTPTPETGASSPPAPSISTWSPTLTREASEGLRGPTRQPSTASAATACCRTGAARAAGRSAQAHPLRPRP